MLIVGVERLSRLLDWEDRNTCVLFGDAAGAMILSATDDPTYGILSTRIHTDGSLTGILNIPGGGSIHPSSHAVVDGRPDKLKMNGREVDKIAVRSRAEVVLEL